MGPGPGLTTRKGLPRLCSAIVSVYADLLRKFHQFGHVWGACRVHLQEQHAIQDGDRSVGEHADVPLFYDIHDAANPQTGQLGRPIAVNDHD